jgi:hypothetical protein
MNLMDINMDTDMDAYMDTDIETGMDTDTEHRHACMKKYQNT